MTQRVVIDTNVIVSGIAYPESIPGKILAAWRSGRLQLVVSHFIVDEIARVLPRLSKAGLTLEEAQDLADSFLFLAQVVDPTEPDEPRLRDPKDLPVLGTLIASDADRLITGDNDLLVLADRYPIMAPADFWKRFGE